MNRDSRSQPFSQIATLWTRLEQAHAGPAAAVPAAERFRMQRYCGAVYRYLLATLPDEETAVALFEEFAARFFHGELRRETANRGGFREGVKRAVLRVVHEAHTARRLDRHQAQPGGASEGR